MTLVHPDEWIPQGVSELEDRAWLALRENTRSVCVTAGAGAGKTEFLAQKAAYLLQTGICPAPCRILAISFKRDAAFTISERMKKRCSREHARRFHSLTFDAFSKGIVDQFRMAIPEPYRPPSNYKIDFTTNNDLDGFLARQNAGNMGRQAFLSSFQSRRILDDTQNFSPALDNILNAFWTSQYTYHAEPYLSFPMINRLAEFLLRSNKRIKRATHMSYPFVFLDEFQDAQPSQFELIQTAFDGSDTLFTAVGDKKQRIMGWAGAMNDAFGTFQRHYNAVPISLLLNWRSHADLVAIQHIIAQKIDPNVEQVSARAERTVTGGVSAIWEFPDEPTEMGVLSVWLTNQIAAGIPAHEMAILVRSKPNDVEAELNPILTAQGQTLRNLARNVGGISIEDLLSEELTDYLLQFLRLAVSNKQAKAWSNALENIMRLDSPAPDDEEKLQKVNQRADRIVRITRQYTQAHPAQEAAVDGLVGLILEEIGETAIRSSVPSYQRDPDYSRVKDGFIALMKESSVDAASWSDVINRMEGIGQIPLLTVHKSKGMEFHTIVFLGLDNQTWWSLKANNLEEINSFFVAFTRAKQRAFFTSCRNRGDSIVWLENLLEQTVPRIDGNSII